MFEALVDLAEGDNTVTIEATDGNSNTTTRSYSVTTDGVRKTLEYDLNGNLRFEKDAGGAVLHEFQWDAKNRLLAIQDAATGSETVGTKRSEFAYDGFDRRVRIVEKTCDGTAWITDSDNVFIWDGSQILQKRDSTGSVVARSYFNNGFEEAGADYFYTKDHLGSIREVVAANGTTIEAVYDYSPWGEISKVSGNSLESDFLYTGHFYHKSGNLHLTLYRAYDPELGRWLSREPIAENGSINLYAYVLNDPINKFDNNGLWTLGVGFTASIEFFGYSGSISAGLYVGYDPCSSDRWSGGVLFTAGGGTGIIASASAGGFVQVTNANRVHDLKGIGYDIGANVSTGFAGLQGGTL